MTERTYKAADVERITGINAVTLRAYRRQGVLAGMGFSSDGTTARFILKDMVLLTVAARIRDHVPFVERQAIEAAIALRNRVQKILDEDKQDVWAFVCYQPVNGLFKQMVLDAGEKLDWADLMSVAGTDRVAIMIGLSDIVYDIKRSLLKENGGDQMDGEES